MSTPESTRADQVTALLRPVLAASGLVVDAVDAHRAGPRLTVTVVVDRDISGLDPADTRSPVAPLSLDEVADAAELISAALDDADPFGATPYTLEVTSPGVARALRTPEAFRRNVGRIVTVTRAEGPAVTGRLVEVAADELELLVTPEVLKGRKPKPPAPQRLPLGAVRSGRVEVEFSRVGGDDDPTDDEFDDVPDDDGDEFDGDEFDDDLEGAELDEDTLDDADGDPDDPSAPAHRPDGDR